MYCVSVLYCKSSISDIDAFRKPTRYKLHIDIKISGLHTVYNKTIFFEDGLTGLQIHHRRIRINYNDLNLGIFIMHNAVCLILFFGFKQGLLKEMAIYFPDLCAELVKNHPPVSLQILLYIVNT